MATSNVSVLRTGTGFTIDVTAANLSTDTTLKDFLVLVGGVVDNNANWTKTTPTVLTYSGASLASNTTVEVRRRTPAEPIQVVAYAQRFSSGDFNNEIDRITRRAEEYDLNGIGPGSVLTTATPINTAFGASWSTDTLHPPSAAVVYNWGVTLARLASPVFTGNPTAPTPTVGDNDTSIATTAFVQTAISPLAPKDSPTFTGTPAAPTPTVGDSTTKLATTAFVATSFAPLASPVFTGNPTAPTASLGDDDTSLATTAFAQDLYRPAFRATRTTGVTLSGAGPAVIASSKDFDTDSAYSTSTGRFTVPAGMGGVYVFGANFVLREVTTIDTHLTVYWRKNGVGHSLVSQHRHLNNGSYESYTGTAIMQLSAGDYVEVYLNNPASGTTNVDLVVGGSYDFQLWGYRIGV